MAKQPVAVELFYDGAWHDLVTDDDVLADTPITIRRGNSDEGGGIRPSSISLKLANDDDMFRISNPESPLYGKVGRNTPLRVSVAAAVRGIGEVASWKCDQSRSFRKSPRRGNAWCDVEAGGILRRVLQWGEPIQSPFTQYNSELPSLLGYWPLEDARGVTYPKTTVATSKSGLNKNLAFQSQYKPGGSDPVADIDLSPVSTKGFFGPPLGTSQTGYQISWATKITEFDSAETYGIFNWETDNGILMQFAYSAGNFLTLATGGGVSMATIVPIPLNLGSAGWILYTIEASYSGGTTTVRTGYRAEGESGFTTWSDTYAGEPGTPQTWFVTGIQQTEASIGHIVAINVPSTVQNLRSGTRVDAFDGYPQERSSYRIARLCDDRQIPYYVSNNFTDSREMGIQSSDPFPRQLEEIAATEDALIFDYRSELRMFFVSSDDRYGLTPKLILTPDDLPFLPAEVTDDLPTFNIVTAKQRDGGSAVAEDSTSPMGTQDPPDGVGINRQTVDVNVYDELLLPQIANWWMRRGTIALPRYPQLTIDLNAVPSLLAAVESVDVGDVIELRGYREYALRLQILGYTEMIGTHSRKIVFNCMPDDAYMTGEWNSSASVWDSKTTTLSTARNKNDTTLVFTMTDNKGTWSQTSNYDVLIAGELIGIKGANVSAATGTGPYTQTITGVTRSKNGIVKSLAAGESVHVATPGRWAL